MVSNLNTYPNLQYNPISIQDFCVVEIYKDTIVKENSLGYCILPIKEGDMEQKIREKVAESMPEGYTNLAILAGRAKVEYNHKVVYAVWYQNEMPTYPEAPVISDLPPVSAAYNIYQEIEVNNLGTAPAYIELELTCSSVDEPIDFYINGKFFSVTIEKNAADTHTLILNKNGVFYNGAAIDTFICPSAPRIESGINHLLFNRSNIQNVKLNYLPKF